MHPTFLPKTHLTQFLTALLLLVPLIGCGPQNQPTASSHSTPISSISNSPLNNQSDNLSLNKTGVSIDNANLHIDASRGVQCPSGFFTQGPPDNPGPISGGFLANNLVLATNRLTYDSSELQQMSDNVKSVNPNQTPMPATLRWVLGGPIDRSRKVIVNGHLDGYVDDCSLELDLTNTGQSLIQIAGVGVQLTGSTHQNDYQYRLIDVCTLPNLHCGDCSISDTPWNVSPLEGNFDSYKYEYSPLMDYFALKSGGYSPPFYDLPTVEQSPDCGGSESPCDEYFATIKLGLNSTSTVLSATPVGREGPFCGELTLNPGEVKSLFVYFYSPSNLIYSVVPQLILDTPSGKNTLQLPQLMSRLAFAKGNQFTCYGLQGDTFVVEKAVLATSDCM